MIISIDTEQDLDKIQDTFMIKKSPQSVYRGNIPNIIKAYMTSP